MGIKALSQETMDAAQEELKDQFLSAPIPKIKNTSAVLELGLTNQFVYLGRQYLVEPISFTAGVRLQELMNTMTQNRAFAEAEGMELNERYIAMCIEAMDIVWKYSIPVKSTTVIRKKLRLMKNPFHEASEGEVMALISFFSKLRMLSSVRWNSLTSREEEQKRA